MRLKMKGCKSGILLAILAALLWSSAACGQEAFAGQEEVASSDDWDVHLMPYFWMLSIEATSTINGLSDSADLSFGDVLDYLDCGAMGRMEAWQDKWGLTFDGIYLNLSAPDLFTVSRGLVSFDFDINVRFGMADFGLAHRLLEERFGDNNQQRIAFEPYGGVRYAYLRQKVDVDVDIGGMGTAGRSVGTSEDWVEPFVGGRLIWDLNDKLAFNIRGDAGGFGIDGASDLTWQFVVGADYKLAEGTSLSVGYRILNVDYITGSGSDAFGLESEAKGPFVGMTILF